MRIQVLDETEQDLVDGFNFYESREIGLGSCFLDSLIADVDSLQLYAGVHPVVFGYHRMLAQRFSYAIYCDVSQSTARVWAVVDCRRNPLHVQKRLDHDNPELR